MRFLGGYVEKVRLVILLLTLMGIGLSGCQGRSEDSVQVLELVATPLAVPEGAYLNVAWVDKSHLAFVYTGGEIGEQWTYQLVIYSTDTQEWRVLQTPQSAECDWTSPVFPTRLPNGRLSFMNTCHVYHDGTTGVINRIYMWDQDSGEFHQLQQYPENFVIGPFAFSPDMAELIQEEGVGPGLNNEFYRVQQDGQMERLFPNYQRVRSPSWSPDGHTIAFMGTETGPDGDFADLLRYPWDLYLMDADGGNVRIVLPGIRSAGGPDWSPDGKFLAFTGGYAGREGTWVLNIDTLQVTQVWPYPTGYDWSPDGSQMVILERNETNNSEHPAIIDLPSDLLGVDE